MTLVTIVLNETDWLENLLFAFSENGIKGATILDSTGMARTLISDNELGFMSSLRNVLDPDRETSKTVFVLVKEDKVKTISKILNEVTGGLDKPDSGIMFCMPVSYTEGILF
ncbi:MAG TPA: hypothetical protein VFD52_03120 [Clostridia bacterium]|nr:hypothetical protein [Clostridia bacterium]